MTTPPVSLNMVQPSPTEEREELSTLIERLREAAGKATPGPWCGHPVIQLTASQWPSHWMWSQPPQHVYLDKGYPALTPENGEYIALANPTNILALLDSHQRLQEVVRRMDRERLARAFNDKLAELEGDEMHWECLDPEDREIMMKCIDALLSELLGEKP